METVGWILSGLLVLVLVQEFYHYTKLITLLEEVKLLLEQFEAGLAEEIAEDENGSEEQEEEEWSL